MTGTVRTVFIVIGAIVMSLLLWNLFFIAGVDRDGTKVPGGVTTSAAMSFELAMSTYYEKYCFIPNSAVHANLGNYKLGTEEKPTVGDCYGVNFKSVSVDD